MKSLLVMLGVILIGLLILGYAELCGAGDAWVLWHSVRMITNAGSSDFHWEILAVYTTQAECKSHAYMNEDFARKMEKKWKESGQDVEIKIFENGTVFETHRSKEGIFIVETKCLCLPDTIDPRK